MESGSDIPDTSSDSSSDTIIVSNDEIHHTPSQSLDENAELDNLFKKYLGEDYSPKNNLDDGGTFSINQKFDKYSLPKINKQEDHVNVEIEESSQNNILKYNVPSVPSTSKQQYDSSIPIKASEYYDLVEDLPDEDLESFTFSKKSKSDNLHSVQVSNDLQKPDSSQDDKETLHNYNSNMKVDEFYDLSEEELPDVDLPRISSAKKSELNGSFNVVVSGDFHKSDLLQEEIQIHDNYKRKMKANEFYDLEEEVPPKIDLLGISSSKKSKLDSLSISGNFHQSDSSIEDIEILNKYESKGSKTSDKERIRQQKLQEKERKKEEERRNKALKEALVSHYKNMKPENCLKFIKTHIDDKIIGEKYFQDILNDLQNNGISFLIESQAVSSTITWTRQIDTNILDLDGRLIDTSKGIMIEEILVIMNYDHFINQVHKETFISHIGNLCENLKGKKLILAIYELQKYYRFQKNKKNREFVEEISDKKYKPHKDDKEFSQLPVVSRRTVEYALTEIQLSYSVSHKMVENSGEMGQFVFQLTKSIAQIPYKLEKQEKFLQSKWLVSEDNKNCIRVDKNGNGLSRLWKQMITTFPLASLETAEAITSVYPTPLNLIKAYEDVNDTSEGEKLLQDIPIRRTAGPITSMRKVGPELSKKLYHMFISLDPDKML